MYGVSINNQYPPDEFYSKKTYAVESAVSLISRVNYVCIYVQNNTEPIIIIWNTYTKGIQVSLIDKNYQDIFYEVRRAIKG